MRVVLVMLALSALAGCAGLAPLRPAAPVTAAPPQASGPATARPAPAADDSAPSAEALAVLATIPEPLPPGERVARPGPAVPTPPAMREARADTAAAAAGAAGAAADTATLAPADSATALRPDTSATGAAGPADSAEAGVPVPERTQPLGDRPGSGGPALAESTLVPKAMKPAGGAHAARPDTCWRLQIGAPPEQEKAQALMDLASSQLLTPFVIEFEKKRYKVRSHDCMGKTAAYALGERAKRTGFRGAFVIKALAKGRQP